MQACCQRHCSQQHANSQRHCSKQHADNCACVPMCKHDVNLTAARNMQICNATAACGCKPMRTIARVCLALCAFCEVFFREPRRWQMAARLSRLSRLSKGFEASGLVSQAGKCAILQRSARAAKHRGCQAAERASPQRSRRGRTPRSCQQGGEAAAAAGKAESGQKAHRNCQT